MHCVQPYAKMLAPLDYGQPFLISDGLKALQCVENFGRVSHRSEEKQTGQSHEKFLRSVVLGHGDWSITEHVVISVEFLVDRGITHELVRHRLAAYTQESTRFVNYVTGSPPQFIYPKPGEYCSTCLSRPGDGPIWNGNGYFHSDGFQCHHDEEWVASITQAERSYQRLLAKKWRPQEARSVFPNALASKIICTYNLRTWRHIFLMRTSKEAHPQMREVMIPLLEQFKLRVPVLYEDLEPEQKQSINLSKMR